MSRTTITGTGRVLASGGLARQAYDVVAGIDVDDFAGNA
jgi:hypothetical protein